MARSRKRLNLAAGAMLLVVGCGRAPAPQPQPSVRKATSAAPATDFVAKPMQGRWLATAACSLIDRQEVANAVHAWVQATELSDVSYPTRRRGGASTCLYTLADGSSVAMLIREMPRPSLTDAVIEQARVGDGSSPPWEVVPDLGRPALWSSDRNTLQLFLDRRRYVALDITDPPPDRDPKAIMAAIARKID